MWPAYFLEIQQINTETRQIVLILVQVSNVTSSCVTFVNITADMSSQFLATGDYSRSPNVQCVFWAMPGSIAWIEGKTRPLLSSSYITFSSHTAQMTKGSF